MAPVSKFALASGVVSKLALAPVSELLSRVSELEIQKELIPKVSTGRNDLAKRALARYACVQPKSKSALEPTWLRGVQLCCYDGVSVVHPLRSFRSLKAVVCETILEERETLICNKPVTCNLLSLISGVRFRSPCDVPTRPETNSAPTCLPRIVTARFKT